MDLETLRTPDGQRLTVASNNVCCGLGCRFCRWTELLEGVGSATTLVKKKWQVVGETMYNGQIFAQPPPHIL